MQTYKVLAQDRERDMRVNDRRNLQNNNKAAVVLAVSSSVISQGVTRSIHSIVRARSACRPYTQTQSYSFASERMFSFFLELKNERTENDINLFVRKKRRIKNFICLCFSSCQCRQVQIRLIELASIVSGTFENMNWIFCTRTLMKAFLSLEFIYEESDTTHDINEGMSDSQPF
jgi:hypothetical protein